MGRGGALLSSKVPRWRMDGLEGKTSATSGGQPATKASLRSARPLPAPPSSQRSGRRHRAHSVSGARAPQMTPIGWTRSHGFGARCQQPPPTGSSATSRHPSPGFWGRLLSFRRCSISAVPCIPCVWERLRPLHQRWELTACQNDIPHSSLSTGSACAGRNAHHARDESLSTKYTGVQPPTVLCPASHHKLNINVASVVL